MNFSQENIERFGERDYRELRVNPQHGRAGTVFHFTAFRLEEHQMVRVVIRGPGHYIIYNSEQKTDDDGSLDYLKLHLTATVDWPLGIYTFSVDDKEMTFKLEK